MRGVLASLQQRGLRSGLNSWMETSHEMAEARRQLSSAASSMRNRGLRQAFNSWFSVMLQLKSMLNAASFLVRRSERLCLGTNGDTKKMPHRWRCNGFLVKIETTSQVR